MSTNPKVVSTPHKLVEPHALDAGTPLLFLPVYLEARLIDLPAGGSELWVRIYPDQISINAHEQELTQPEIDDGKAYWNSLWSLGKSAAPEDRRVPWRDLAAKCGAQRAAWIALQMTPNNLAQQPAAAATIASLTLTFGSSAITFQCSRSGAAGNRVQIAVDDSSQRETPLSVAGNLLTIYAKWDGTPHTTSEIASFFPSTQTDDGGSITASAAGTPKPLTATAAAHLSGGSDPSLAPAFPAPPTRASSWEKPAIADALPDSWKIILISGTQKTVAESKSPVQLDLATTMDPHAGAFPAGSPVDAGLRWLVNFDAAMDAGMAVKVPLTVQQRAAGFDRMIVYGLRSRDENGAGTLGDLLNAHHYTDGFALVPQGSPTNNTSDASSAYSRKDTDYATSFAVERNGPLIQGPQVQPDVDGNRFATMLGLDASRMANVQYAEHSGVRNGSDMLTAIWPSTLGYFLSQLMTPGFPAELIGAAQDYALSHAVPRGPVPAFRAGRTPYGVLPVTALSRYKLTDADGATPIEEFVARTVRQLWPIWLQSAAHAPHIQRGGDADTQLSLVLGMDASSSSFRGRPVLGSEFLWNYMDFEGMPAVERNSWTTQRDQEGRRLFDSLGFHSWDPRVMHLSSAQSSFPVVLPRVQAGVLSETDPLVSDAVLGTDVGGNLLTGNYIQWLAQASIQDIRAENYPGHPPNALLYKILRMSTILEYGKLATNAEIAAGKLTVEQIREQELVGMGKIQSGGGAGATMDRVGLWDVLNRPSIPDPTVSWSEYLDHVGPSAGGAFVKLTHFRVSLKNLALLPTAELDRLLTETLDSCSHRLDVWATAVATAMLKRARQKHGVTGVHLAAYGWLEDLRPSAKGSPVQGTELKLIEKLDALRSERGSKEAPLPALQPQADNGGFIYAPSQDQAAVAAILRSGYMTHQGTGDQDALSIDLSSERVQGALMLLDGVRQGQSLNALLGYLFESGLHDLNLQKYIQPFRDRYPMAANQVAASAADAAAVSSVVDGMALKTAWDNHQLDAGGNWGTGLPSPAQPQDQAAVVGLLQTIDGYADSLADLSIAEALYQTIRGNFERGGGLLAAVSRGAQIPDPGVITTRRGGLDITHRAGLLFAGAPSANAWNGNATRARAMAEPWLDAWLSQMLPDPSLASTSCSVSYHDAALGDKSVTVQLSQLNIAPLDCIAMAESSTNESQRSEIEYRILFAAGVPPTADPNSITIAYTPTDDKALSIPDLLYLWKSLRLLIFGARPITPQDFVLPAKKAGDSDGSIKLADLLARTKAALKKMQDDLRDLSDSMSGGSHPEKLPERLWACSFYGVPGSVPFSNTPGDPRLAAQATQVSSTLTDRCTKAASLINNATATAADLMSAFALMFGKDFMVLPAFTLSSSNLQAVQNAFQQSDGLVASDPVAPMRWLTQLSYVRPAMARLDAAIAAAEICGESVTLPKLKLGQLPVQANDRWLGLAWEPDKPPGNGRLAFACFTVGDPTAETAYAGLLIDEWLDRVPSPQEKAAVAFHYNEPSASPPHALLLGVCPDQRKYWDDDLVSALLEETLELAKIRTVDLQSIQRVGQILPALYFPLNLRGAAPSAHFFNRAGGA